jgi:hypothetical protein
MVIRSVISRLFFAGIYSNGSYSRYIANLAIPFFLTAASAAILPFCLDFCFKRNK